MNDISPLRLPGAVFTNGAQVPPTFGSGGKNTPVPVPLVYAACKTPHRAWRIRPKAERRASCRGRLQSLAADTAAARRRHFRSVGLSANPLYNDGLSQRELSQRAHLTEPTAHSALTKLEKQGIIARKKVDSNKRTLQMFLTAKGWELRDRLEPMARDVNERSLQGLVDEDERILRKGLLAIIRNLEEDEEQAARQGIKMPATRPTM